VLEHRPHGAELLVVPPSWPDAGARPSPYQAITRVHTMPLSSRTTTRVAPQTAQPLTVAPSFRPAAIVG